MDILLRHITKRLILVPFQVWAIFSMVFLLMRAIPVNPARAILGESASDQAVRAYEKLLGLDQPLYVQYYEQLNSLLRGNIGVSYQTFTPVWDSVSIHFPITVEVTAGGMIVALLLGWSLGAVAGAKKGSKFDNFNRFYGGLLASMPVFWLGLLLQMFSLGRLPIEGISSSWNAYRSVTGFAIIDSALSGGVPAVSDVVLHYFLSWVTLGLIYSGIHARFLRANMVQVMNEDFIEYCKMRGLPWWRSIVFKHAFRNSLIPVITLVALHIATLLGGAIITEIVFNIPGMGLRLYSGIYSADYPIVQGFMVFIGIVIVLVSTLADIAVSLIDPRVRY